MPKPSGLVFVDGREIGETMKCVHCGRQWLMVRGSGRRRGFCMNCGGITCGNDSCNVCVPIEKKLELYEQGKIQTLK